ncbi:hypothetical protein PTE_04084 [Photorhabdus khanii NC19]|uniref:Uncharacterized protein n=1 Tax=Photorhabdus khanii NC19 TaxID=1004151 RepID=W3V1H0_9GAMM|nr:hypothetical protein PTE_04084 [Photorhabdus khanii NC19]
MTVMFYTFHGTSLKLEKISRENIFKASSYYKKG